MDARRLIRIPIDDFSCAGAAPAIERQLATTRGVFGAYANPATEQVSIVYDPTLVGAFELVHRLNRAGYRTGHPIEA